MRDVFLLQRYFLLVRAYCVLGCSMILELHLGQELHLHRTQEISLQTVALFRLSPQGYIPVPFCGGCPAVVVECLESFIVSMVACRCMESV